MEEPVTSRIERIRQKLLAVWNGKEPVTKQMLGLALLGAGLVLCMAIVAIDWFGAGLDQGFGRSQRLALAASLAVAIGGIPLIWLGDRPV